MCENMFPNSQSYNFCSSETFRNNVVIVAELILWNYFDVFSLVNKRIIDFLIVHVLSYLGLVFLITRIEQKKRTVRLLNPTGMTHQTGQFLDIYHAILVDIDKTIWYNVRIKRK